MQGRNVGVTQPPESIFLLHPAILPPLLLLLTTLETFLKQSVLLSLQLLRLGISHKTFNIASPIWRLIFSLLMNHLTFPAMPANMLTSKLAWPWMSYKNVPNLMVFLLFYWRVQAGYSASIEDHQSWFSTTKQFLWSIILFPLLIASMPALFDWIPCQPEHFHFDVILN